MRERVNGFLLGAGAVGAGVALTTLLTGSGAASTPSSPGNVPKIEKLNPYATCSLNLEPVAPTKLHQAGHYMLHILTTSDRRAEVLTLTTSSVGPFGREQPGIQTSSIEEVSAGDTELTVPINLSGDSTQATVYLEQGSLTPNDQKYDSTYCTQAVLTIEPTYIGATRPTAAPSR